MSEKEERLEDALFISEMDQQVSLVRDALRTMDQDDMIELFKDCGKGLVKEMLKGDDGRLSLLIGRLAAIGIWYLLGPPNREDL